MPEIITATLIVNHAYLLLVYLCVTEREVFIIKTKQRIYGDSPRLVLILLCLAILLHASLAAQGKAAKLRLIREEQLEDFEPMAEVMFLGKPKSVAPGQAEFSPILFVSKDGERYTVRAQGAGIR